MQIREEFEDIRPYFDKEINPALQRITAVPEFGKILEFLFPEKKKEDIINNLLNVNTAIDFQKQFMHPLVYSIVDKTSKGLTTSGFEHLKPGTPYLFVGNHRDIVLDSAILQVILVDFGHETSEITFGSNLMTNQFIIDLGKVNRMFKVNRGGNRMELFRNSQILSAYIRYTLTHKKTSAWIAQRSGRTKDGSDKTETGLLKMFNISGTKDFISSFSELNIVPLSISYEYEPCCAIKVKEMTSVARGIPYQKEPNEDLVSIITGITRPKGRIHLAACTPVNQMIHETEECHGTNEKINRLAALMDTTIYRNYKLWPNNYIAFDLLNKSQKYSHMYSQEEMEKFAAYTNQELSIFSGDTSLQRELLLKIYANPVINSLAVNS
ncbi:MAG: acyltransferase [Bacteroidales bacterium]|nr:acyltransferase [Bacteroidales bacterium]